MRPLATAKASSWNSWAVTLTHSKFFGRVNMTSFGRLATSSCMAVTTVSFSPTAYFASVLYSRMVLFVSFSSSIGYSPACAPVPGRGGAGHGG